MRIDLPEHKRCVFEMNLPVRWGDMDALGHVNNASYFRYMETVRIDWMRSIGRVFDDSAQGPVILNAFCNFYREITFPGDLLARFFVSDPGRTTFESWTTLARTDQPEVVCAAGGATVAWVDFQKKKSIELPDWLRSVVHGA